MAVRSPSRSPLQPSNLSPTRLPVTPSSDGATPVAISEQMVEWGTPLTQPAAEHSPTGSSRSTASTPTSEHMSRLRKPRQWAATHRVAGKAGWASGGMAAPTPTCTPTQTPLQTPITTPATTPSRPMVPGREGSHVSTSASASCCAVVAAGHLHPCAEAGEGAAAAEADDSALPPVPTFSSRFPASPAKAVVATSGASGCGKGGSCSGMTDGRAGPFAGQGQRFGGGGGGVVRGEGGRGRCRGGSPNAGQGGEVGLVCGAKRQDKECVEERRARLVPSLEAEVEGMFDESQGTLRLSRDVLGDERVPFLSLQRLRDAYRDSTGSLRSWTTAGAFETAGGALASAGLVEVDYGRLGVLSSTAAYTFHFQIKPRRHSAQLASVLETGVADEEAEREFDLVYVWLGREAEDGAHAAARAQGGSLLRQRSCAMLPSSLLEVEQGCEPALFLALFSYMLPPLAAVVLQGRDEGPGPDLRVLELQESPCLHGCDIALAVEGDASLLAKHGPLPGRSYLILVRPHRRKAASGSQGCGGSQGDGEFRGTEGVGVFDEGYYWHGIGETPAVEGVGVLLSQQVDRMFPPASTSRGLRRKGSGKRQRSAVFGCGMMRGFVADVKLGLPVPDGFWACILPERSPSSVFGVEDQMRMSQDLRPCSRSRPVRVFGICAESRKAGQRFVWEVTAGGMPSQMRLSPSLSHVVDAGGVHVYVWHGAGSHGDGRRLACRVARAYAMRVEGEVTVVQADAGSEPIGLLDCFIGWNQALVEPPPFLTYSPPKSTGKTDASSLSSLSSPATAVSGDTSGAGSTRSGPGTYGHRRSGRRGSGTRAHSSGSNSSASRLTPPGQRTPPLVVSSPPLLKNMGSTSRGYSSSGGGLPTNSKAFLTPPRRQELATMRELAPKCEFDASLSIPQRVPPAVGALVNRPSSRTPGVASPSRDGDIVGSGLVVVEEVNVCTLSRSTAAGGTCCAGTPQGCPRSGKQYDSHQEGQRRADGLERGVCSSNVVFCARGKGESGEGRGGSRCERSVDPGRGGDGGGDHKVSDEDTGSGGANSRGGGGAGDSGGAGAGAGGDDIGNGDEGNNQDEEEEEEDEEDEDEESDTFLRLSGIEFCQGAGALLGAADAAAEAPPRTNSEVFDSTNSSGSSSGRGDRRVLSRHLSDFFRSPLASQDSTPLTRFSSIKSLSDVQTGACLFDSRRSLGSDISGVRRGGTICSSTNGKSGSGSVDGGVNVCTASVGVGVVDGSPRDCVSPTDGTYASGGYLRPRLALSNRAAREPAEGLPCPDRNESIAMIDRRKKRSPSSPVEQPSRGQVEAASDTSSDETKIAVAPLGTENSVDCDSRNQGGSLGGESEEEWLSHPGGASANGHRESWSSDSLSSTSRLHEEVQLTRCDGEKVPGTDGREADVRECDKVGQEDAMVKSRRWAGLNDDGSWRSEVARRAAGQAGAVEAERRRLAMIREDESWRSDGGGEGCERRCALDVRRESMSFTGLLKGNVRDKLSVFEGCSGSTAGKAKMDDRSSIGTLHGRGLVSAWNKKNAERLGSPTTPVALSPATEEDSADSTCSSCSPTLKCPKKRTLGASPADRIDQSEQEFVWKEGPAPRPLRGRPSLGLIRSGQVRILSKQLLMSCPEGADEDIVGGNQTRSCKEVENSQGEGHGALLSDDSRGSSIQSFSATEPPMPSTPPPPPPLPSPPAPPVSAVIAPLPLSARSRQGGDRTSESPAKARIPRLSAKDRAGCGARDSTSPSSAPAPATPVTNRTWWQHGGTLPSPPSYLEATAGRTGSEAVAAAVRASSAVGSRGGVASGSATGALAKLRRRLAEEGKALLHEGQSDSVSPSVGGT